MELSSFYSKPVKPNQLPENVGSRRSPHLSDLDALKSLNKCCVPLHMNAILLDSYLSPFFYVSSF